MDNKRCQSPLLEVSSKRAELDDSGEINSNPMSSGQQLSRKIEIIDFSETNSKIDDNTSMHSTDINDILEAMYGPNEETPALQFDTSADHSDYSNIRSSTPIDVHYQPLSPDASFFMNITFDEMDSEEILAEFMRDETSSEGENDWWNDSFQQFIEGIEEDFWDDSGIFSFTDS